jgi:hypothetical protein
MHSLASLLTESLVTTADRIKGFQIVRIPANMLNKQSWTAKKKRVLELSGWGGGGGAGALDGFFYKTKATEKEHEIWRVRSLCMSISSKGRLQYWETGADGRIILNEH